jgi:hypothetical protein
MVPDASFIAILLFFLGLFVFWPLGEALSRRQWGWALAIVLLAPVAGVFWFVVGRRMRHRIQVAP